jgi:hypothetical protein
VYQEESVLLPGRLFAAHGASSPQHAAGAKPKYVDLQLRCQALECALEQQAASSQGALAAAVSGAAAEEASIRAFYEAQVNDLLGRLAAQADALPPGENGSILAAAPTPDASTQQQSRPGSAPSASGRRGGGHSPTAGSNTRRSLQAPLVSASSDVGALRRELAAAEALLAASQEGNRAAAKRIKVCAYARAGRLRRGGQALNSEARPASSAC